MFKNFWYAIEFSEALSAQPVCRKVLGQDLVLYRAGDQLVCLSNLCPHRGGNLSDGKVLGDRIECPYHGWCFDPTGACTKIPANEPGAAIPKRARVDSYPVLDRYGWIWVFLGDLPEEERPPLPQLQVPQLEDPGYRRITGEFLWHAHYSRVIENGVDFAHAPFVHGSSFGNPDKPEVPDYEVEQGEYSALASTELEPSPARGIWRALYRKEKARVRTTNGFWMPNITLLKVELPLGNMLLFDANVPVDDDTTLTKWMLFRSFLKGRWADADTRRRVRKIFLQDQRIVENIRPELLPFDLTEEVHVKSDRIQNIYRRMRQHFMEMGWGIDTQRIRSEYSGRHNVIIPSPGRREHPEWSAAWSGRELPLKTPPPGG